MAGENLVLYVGTYDDSTTAASDYQALKSAKNETELDVLASVVVTKDADGKVTVDEKGTGQVGGRQRLRCWRTTCPRAAIANQVSAWFRGND